jgi:hypothetical protein
MTRVILHSMTINYEKPSTSCLQLLCCKLNRNLLSGDVADGVFASSGLENLWVLLSGRFLYCQFRQFVYLTAQMVKDAKN